MPIQPMTDPYHILTPPAGVTISEEIITPDQAHAYLGRNLHNRNIREPHALAMARDMASGDWNENGETIKFSTDNVLLDGQHRLAAICVANIPIKLLVVRGLPMQAQETIDTGRRRSFGDVLKLRGEANVSNLASITRGVASWEKGERGYATNFTTAEMLAVLEKYPHLRESVGPARSVQKGTGLTASIGGTCWWLFGQIDSEDRDAFFDRLASDLNHSAGEPIAALRGLLLSNNPRIGSGSDGTKRYTLAVVIKAWNTFRDGGQIQFLTFRTGGARPEVFPEPR